MAPVNDYYEEISSTINDTLTLLRVLRPSWSILPYEYDHCINYTLQRGILASPIHICIYTDAYMYTVNNIADNITGSYRVLYRILWDKDTAENFAEAVQRLLLLFPA